jgi:hypothetical protein
MNVGFYFDDSQRYGNKTREIAKSSNTHYAWCWRYAKNADDPPEVWLPGLQASCQRAVEAGRRIHLNIDMTWPTPIDDVFKKLLPFKDNVDLVEGADEPKWNLSATTSQLRAIRQSMRRTGFGIKPIGIVYSTDQFPVKPGKIRPYDSADWIGVEAYIKPPGDHNSPYNVAAMEKYLGRALGEVERARKLAVVIPMAYSRNYEWRGIGHPDIRRWQGPYLEPDSAPWRQAVKTLVDLQQPIYDMCKDNKRVIGMNFFSWERWSGAREYHALAKEVLTKGALACKL